MGPRGHTKVPQIGRVIIQDDVEIGAGTAIDRGAIRDTVIGEGTKIDNLVQIGHNVSDRPPLRDRRAVRRLPAASRSRISSFWAGARRINNHVTIGEGAQLAGHERRQCRSCRPAAAVAALPAKPAKQWFREMRLARAAVREERQRRERQGRRRRAEPS